MPFNAFLDLHKYIIPCRKKLNTKNYFPQPLTSPIRKRYNSNNHTPIIDI